MSDQPEADNLPDEVRGLFDLEQAHTRVVALEAQARYLSQRVGELLMENHRLRTQGKG